jgi:hypothetical protein
MEKKEDKRSIEEILIDNKHLSVLQLVRSDVDYVKIIEERYTNLVLYSRDLIRSDDLELLAEKLEEKIEKTIESNDVDINYGRIIVVPYNAEEVKDARSDLLNKSLNLELCRIIVDHMKGKKVSYELGDPENLIRRDNVVIISANYFEEMENWIERQKRGGVNILGVLLVVKPPEEYPIVYDGVIKLDIFEREGDLAWNMTKDLR